MLLTLLIISALLSLDYLLFLSHSSTKYITKLIILGVSSRVIFLILTLIFGLNLQINYLISASIGLVSLVIYSQAIVKSLQRQSEVISRFFLDAMPSQQVNIELDQRAGFISSSAAREEKKNLFNSAISIGSFEGLIRWLSVDFWLMGLGSILIGIISYFSNNSILDSFQKASATLFLLSVSSILSALPLVKFLSFLDINRREKEINFKTMFFRLSLVSILSFCFFALTLGFTISLPILFATIIFSLFYIFHSRKKIIQNYLFKRTDNNNFCSESESNKVLIDESIKYINIPVPSNLLNTYNAKQIEEILNTEELLDSISSFVKGVRLYSVTPEYQKINRIVSEKKVLKTLFLSDYYLDRVRDDFGLEISKKNLPQNILNKLKFESNLASYLQDYFIIESASRLSISDSLISIDQKYKGLNSSISLLKQNSYDSFIEAVKTIDSLGYKNIPEDILIEMIIKFSTIDFEPSEFVEELIKLLVEENPHLLSSNDGSAHMVYVSEEALSDEPSLKYHISEIGIRLKKRGISKLVIKVPQLSDNRVAAIINYLKEVNMRACVLDSSIRPRISVFPVLVI